MDLCSIKLLAGSQEECVPTSQSLQHGSSLWRMGLLRNRETKASPTVLAFSQTCRTARGSKQTVNVRSFVLLRLLKSYDYKFKVTIFRTELLLAVALGT